MSRGHGRIQLQVLEYLLRFDEDARARGDESAYVAVLDIAGPAASRSRIESVRRAAKSLADEGLILLRSDDGQRATSRSGRLSSVQHQSRGQVARIAAPSDDAERDAAVRDPSELSA
jgi:hypothetical protein